MVLAASSAYLVFTAADLPLPLYLPVSRRWATAVGPGEIGMDWYARALGSFAAGALALPVGRAIASRSPRAARPRVAKLVFGIAFGVLAWAMLYTVMSLIAA